MRIDWKDFFMKQAENIARQSTCKSGRTVGAVFVLDKICLMSSFNGVPPDYPHPTICERRKQGCASGEKLDLCPCNHAESNGIAQAARYGISLKGSTLYCTAKPCVGCMGYIANAGIKKIIFRDDYPHLLSEEIAKYAKIELEKYVKEPDSPA